MRTKGVIGKRIIAVEQERWGRSMRVCALVLEDGTRLLPNAYETEDRPEVDILVVRPGARRERPVAAPPEREGDWRRVRDLDLKPGDRVMMDFGSWRPVGTVGEPNVYGALPWTPEAGRGLSAVVLYQETLVRLVARAEGETT